MSDIVLKLNIQFIILVILAIAGYFLIILIVGGLTGRKQTKECLMCSRTFVVVRSLLVLERDYANYLNSRYSKSGPHAVIGKGKESSR